MIAAILHVHMSLVDVIFMLISRTINDISDTSVSNAQHITLTLLALKTRALQCICATHH